MYKLFKYVVILAFMFGGWVLAAMSLHVVRAPSTSEYCPVNIQVVTKDRLSFKDTWVDVTRWTPAEVAGHPQVVSRLEEAGKLHLIDHAVKVNQTDTARADPKALPHASAVPASSTEKPAQKSIFDFGN